MDLSSFFANAWVIGIGVTIIGGLILYYIFGVGKSKDKKTISYKKSPHILAKGNISAAGDIIIGNQTIKTKEGKLNNKQLTLDFAERKVT